MTRRQLDCLHIDSTPTSVVGKKDNRPFFLYFSDVINQIKSHLFTCSSLSVLMYSIWNLVVWKRVKLIFPQFGRHEIKALFLTEMKFNSNIWLNVPIRASLFEIRAPQLVTYGLNLISENPEGVLGSRENWVQNNQGARSRMQKWPRSREQKKVI